MKMAIVNPIPASRPISTMPRHSTCGGSAHSRQATAPRAANKMPSGLPITSPQITPRLKLIPLLTWLLPSGTPALASANKGITP